MMTMIQQLRRAARRHAAYIRTVNELSALPPSALRDLNIAPHQIRDFAARAAYRD